MSNKQKPQLIDILEIYNHSLMIHELIDKFIVKNRYFWYKKKSLLNKAEKALQLLSDIHLDAHNSFQIQITVNNDERTEKLIHKRDGKRIENISNLNKQ